MTAPDPMAAAEIAVVTTTLPSPAAGEAIARLLVTERLAACAQTDAIRTCYRWQGAIERAEEERLTLKTAPDRAAALVARLAAIHPYDLPEILHATIAASAAWVAAETRPAA